MADTNTTGADIAGDTAAAADATSASLMLAHVAPDFFGAIESFIHQNATFESSIVQRRVINEIGEAADAMIAFAIPLQNNLLSMNGALLWTLFWRTAIDSEETESFPIDNFTADSALRLMSGVYDVGLQDTVLQHFEISDSDEDEGDEVDSKLDPAGDESATLETDPSITKDVTAEGSDSQTIETIAAAETDGIGFGFVGVDADEADADGADEAVANAAGEGLDAELDIATYVD